MALLSIFILEVESLYQTSNCLYSRVEFGATPVVFNPMQHPPPTEPQPPTNSPHPLASFFLVFAYFILFPFILVLGRGTLWRSPWLLSFDFPILDILHGIVGFHRLLVRHCSVCFCEGVLPCG